MSRNASKNNFTLVRYISIYVYSGNLIILYKLVLNKNKNDFMIKNGFLLDIPG